MKTYTSLDFKLNTPSVVALGCFDGLHIGHRALIKEARVSASQAGLPLAVFSFTAPPKSFFIKSSVPVLTDMNEKKRLMALLGVDILISVDFSAEIAALSPEDFFESIIRQRLCASSVFCGFNYRFGKGAKGDSELLSRLCKENAIDFSAIPSVSVDGVTVSSSAIRELLARGNVWGASKLLGRKYSIRSTVVSGQQLGRLLGFPTVNQLLSPTSAPLCNGVYLTRTRVGRHVWRSITNVGVRPTVDGSTLCAETHLFGFDGNLYGRNIRVEFLEFIRP
ncbi:MAG: riboflavin biosynthesis protein RibF, partial [Clostridia bacterium]|nr:riboflavin biosynthesis protein RibF [Clostridia bacterium]